MPEPSSHFVFIDESGDAGFQLGRGSTPLFCLSAVIFHRPEDIEVTEQIISEVRRAIFLDEAHEFHFNHEPNQIRTSFCRAIASAPFRIRAIVVDKQRVSSPRLRGSSRQFYQFITEQLILHSLGSVREARIYLDGRLDREFRTLLRQRLNHEERLVKKIGFYDSRNNNIIQLADMVAGSIARSYKQEAGCRQWRELISSRIDEVWEFDKEGSPSPNNPLY